MSLIIGAGAIALLTACTQERVEVQVELDPLTQMVMDCEEGSGRATQQQGGIRPGRRPLPKHKSS